MATPEYPWYRVSKRKDPQDAVWTGRTFFVLWETEEDVPARHQNHVVPEIFSLDLGLLHHDNVCLERVKHGLQLSASSAGHTV